MSWRDRVRGSIRLISPDSKTFDAKWVGDSRSAEKKLGIFTYPKTNGTVIQDLGLNGTRYPFRLFFDGEDNDLEATRFFEAFNERGTWAVDHPTKGRSALQPVSVTERIQPIESGSVTVFETQWIEPVSDEVALSDAQLAAIVDNLSDELEDTALDQLEDTAAQATTEEINALVSETEKTLSLYDETIGPLVAASGELAAQAAAIRRGIADTLSLTPLDLTVLGGQIQSIMRLPAQITGDILQTIQPIGDFIDALSALPDEVADQTYINTLAIREVFLTSANSAIAVVSVQPDGVTSRTQALEAVDFAGAALQTITDGLDVAQEQFETFRLDQQYFSQSASFTQSVRITAQATRQLLGAAFDLAVEKRFTLSRERAPIEITITEYGTIDKLDEFIATNQLKSDDILLLPAGREVVVYV